MDLEYLEECLRELIDPYDTAFEKLTVSFSVSYEQEDDDLDPTALKEKIENKNEEFDERKEIINEYKNKFNETEMAEIFVHSASVILTLPEKVVKNIESESASETEPSDYY